MNLNESLIVDEEAANDRELIDDYLLHVKEIQKLLSSMSKRNQELKEICDQQINDNKASSNQGKLALIT